MRERGRSVAPVGCLWALVLLACICGLAPEAVGQALAEDTLEGQIDRLAVTVEPQAIGAEDFSYYQQQIPGLYFFLGITPHQVDPKKAALCHSPRFYAEESAMVLGIRSLAQLTVTYMGTCGAKTP